MNVFLHYCFRCPLCECLQRHTVPLSAHMYSRNIHTATMCAELLQVLGLVAPPSMMLLTRLCCALTTYFFNVLHTTGKLGLLYSLSVLDPDWHHWILYTALICTMKKCTTAAFYALWQATMSHVLMKLLLIRNPVWAPCYLYFSRLVKFLEQNQLSF